MESIIGFFGDRWNEVMRYLHDDFSNSTPQEKTQYANNVRQICATAGAMVAPQPIPIADIWLITPIQYLMVRAIGNIYGYRISESTIAEIFAVIGGGITGQQLCLFLFKIGMPGLGGLAGAGFVFAWTHGIGHAAEAYFKSGMTMSEEELAEIRRQGEAAARKSKSKIGKFVRRVKTIL
jgi:uncharacterized protein (DUF697 family)